MHYEIKNINIIDVYHVYIKNMYILRTVHHTLSITPRFCNESWIFLYQIIDEI